jgi:hypothetical protein
VVLFEPYVKLAQDGIKVKASPICRICGRGSRNDNGMIDVLRSRHTVKQGHPTPEHHAGKYLGGLHTHLPQVAVAEHFCRNKWIFVQNKYVHL